MRVNLKVAADKLKKQKGALIDLRLLVKKALSVTIAGINEKIRAGGKQKNRTILLMVSLLLLLDYLMFCHHTEKNIFNIFPSFPVLSDKEHRTVYLPDLDGKSLITERRELSVPNDRDEFVRLLYKIVSKGSIYDNTSMTVPIETFVRGIWFHEGLCIIDLELPFLKDNSGIIEGSERNFLTALEKTIKENIPAVSRVMVLEKGIPEKTLWETARN